MHKLLHSALAFMFLNAVALTPVLAQTGRGTVTGRVVDSGGGVLQGAEVELQPLGIKAATNNQGEFTFADIAPGAYKVSVNFVGFASSTSDVTVTAGETAHADATLQVAGTNEQVIVTTERVHGEAEAINRTRTAENILQVLPAEVIVSLPNANVADAIGRLPSVTLERDEGEGKYVQIRGAEPRYSNVTIDGVNIPSPESGVRQIKLDIIPSDLVESVEINKTLLANMDGDAIGGSVNLRTKTAGEQPTIELFGLGGYTPIENGRGVTNFGGTIGKRFGKDKRLGVLFGGAYDWNSRGIDDLEPGLNTVQCDSGGCGDPSVNTNISPNAPYYGTYKGTDIREYRYYRTRFGFEGSVDYKFNDNSFVYVRGLYSHFDNFGDRWVYSPAINSYGTSPLQGGPDGSISMNAEIRRPVEQIGSIVAGGHHVWATSTFSWELSASRSGAADHGYSNAAFAPISGSQLNMIQYNVDLSNPYRPKFPVQNGVNIYDPTQYSWSGSPGFDVSTGRSAHVNLQGAVDYSKSYSWNGHFGTFAMGVKVRNGHKYEEANDLIYNAVNPNSLLLSMFPTVQGYSSFYGGSYSLGPLPSYKALTSYFNGNPNAFTLDTNATHTSNDPQNYDLIERVVAGYFMNSIYFGKFRLYAGLRFEGTTENVLGYQVLFNTDANGNSTYASTSPLRKNGGYVDPLPSVELRYSLAPDSGIRLAYGRGIARPNFGDLAPTLSLTPVPGGVSTSSVGNANLKATHANNYDVLFEQYLHPLGMIQAGFFYKDITDPIYTVQTDMTYPGFPGITFRQQGPVNGASAWLYGFEIAYQQRLSYLPGPLSGLGISGNYSYTASRASFTPDVALARTDHPALQRQAPHTWNISPTYDKGRVSVRVGLTYNAANIFAYNYTDGAPLGIKGPNGDNYLYAHLQIDAQGSVRLPKGFTAVVYGLNLNNEVFGFYNGSPTWVVQREYYKTTYGAGLRWNSGPEK